MSFRRSDPVIPQGVSLPGGFEDEEEVDFIDMVTGVWSVEASLPVLRENWHGIEVALVAETSDSEALKPRNLAEAKRCPDWPLWEQAICDISKIWWKLQAFISTCQHLQLSQFTLAKCKLQAHITPYRLTSLRYRL